MRGNLLERQGEEASNSRDNHHLPLPLRKLIDVMAASAVQVLHLFRHNSPRSLSLVPIEKERKEAVWSGLSR